LKEIDEKQVKAEFKREARGELNFQKHFTKDGEY